MIRAEFRRIMNVPTVRIWLFMLSFLLFFEGSIVFLQSNRIIFGAYSVSEECHQLEYDKTFNVNLQEKLDQLYSQKDSILFSDPKQQALLGRKIETLTALQGSRESLTHTDIYKRVLSFIPVWSLITLMTAVLLSYYLFLEDDAAQLQMLYASAFRARVSRASSKLTVMTVIILIVCLMITSAELLICHLCGIPGNIPVQSINGFFTAEINITAAGYIAGINLRVFAGVILTIFMFIFFYMIRGSWTMSAGILLPLFIAEYLIFFFMSAASPIAFLKHINLYSALFSADLWQGWVAAFGHLLGKCDVLVVFLLSACILLAAGILHRYGKTASLYRNRRRKRSFRTPKTISGFHIREILIHQKGLLILLLMSIFCIGNAARYNAVRPADEIRYEAFRKLYYGEINDELLERIKNDRQKSLAALEKRDEYLAMLPDLNEEQRQELEELTALSAQADYIDRVDTEIHDLYESGAHVYADHSGIQYLMRKNDRAGSIMDFVTAVIPAGLLSIAVIGALKKGCMAALINSSASGKKTVLQNNAKLLIVFVFICVLIVYGSHAVRVINSYPLKPAGTVSETMGVASDMPVWLYLFFHCLHVLLMGITLVVLAVYVSERFSFIPALIIWAAMLALIILSPWISCYLCFDYPLYQYSYMGFSMILFTVDYMLYSNVI